MNPLRTLGDLDAPFAWNGRRLYRAEDFAPDTPVPFELRGAVASVTSTSSEARLMRDPLGLNKLFWVLGASHTLFLSARPKRLVAEGFALKEIRAIPRGCVLDRRPGAAGSSSSSIVPKQWQEARAEWAGTASINNIGTRIRCNLDWYLDAIAAAHPAARAFVCCSGGLDSSGIAALVARHFSDVVGVSFDLDRRGCGASEDRAMAERLCHDLGIPLLKATVRPERLLDHLDTVLVEGIDWRDFNVHAGLVNAVLAEAVAATKAREPIVFTGDLANEFLADYHEEKYQGETYYRLPRLSPGALRASLVRGLDTSNREVGVFAAWGLPIVQPYAVAVDAYLDLPNSFLRLPDAKQQLCRSVFGDLVPSYVYERPKVRAQIGDAKAGAGVLATCVDRGFDQEWLRGRFALLHDANPGDVERFMRGGRYRAAVPTREEW